MIEGMLAEPTLLRGYPETRLPEFMALLPVGETERDAQRRALSQSRKRRPPPLPAPGDHWPPSPDREEDRAGDCGTDRTLARRAHHPWMFPT
jgi:hypothetical protein